jgi:acetoin utilization deacetylase AcuC-like enzyme
MTDEQMKPIVYYNPTHKCHTHGSMHPEAPQRVEAIMARLQPSIDDGDLVLQTFDPIHPLHIERPIRSWKLKDGDTYFTPYTNDVLAISYRMIGQAVDDLLSEKTRCAFVLCRPPGHHASSKGPSGFCLENNVWTAVQKLHKAGKYKIGIYDWDVHHGDGTEDLIEKAVGSEYDSLRFVSTHAYGHGIFPGTGAYKKTNRILDLPLPKKTGGSIFFTTFRNDVVPFLKTGGDLDLLIVSAGYDAHRNDPMELMRLETEVYGYMAKMLQSFHVPILFLLEGGYSPSALADSVLETLKPFMPPTQASPQ